MKTYLAYKNQTEGIKDVSETVRTVEKIAASSVHFLRQEVSNINTYANEIEKMMARLSLFYQAKNNPLLKINKNGKKMIVILTGDKGLVGSLWYEIINIFLKNSVQYKYIVVIGAKGENYLKEESIKTTKSFINFFDIPQKREIENITKYIFDEFNKGTYSHIDILYPQFISLAQQLPTITPFLPFKFTLEEIRNHNNSNATTDKLKKNKNGNTGEGFPIFEPSKRKIFETLLQEYIGIFFHKIVMETKLSELSARTVAMEHAAAKTKELIKKLELDYTKQRRRTMTQRQLESFASHQII